MRATLAGRPLGGRIARSLVASGLAAMHAACGAPAGLRAPGAATRRLGEGRPSLVVIDREGDPMGAIAVAVTTTGIAPERGATVGVSLGALVEARVAARLPRTAATRTFDPSVTGGWDGWRLRAFARTELEGAALVEAVRAAMVEPVTGNDTALLAVARKVGALARRRVADRALTEVTQCTGDAYGSGAVTTPSASELEAWRRAAHGLGRVAIATTGPASLADAVASALRRAPAWPSATTVAPSPWPSAEALVVFDASGDVAPGAASLFVTAHTATPERAIAAAELLGDPRGALASRLSALAGRPRLRSVVAAAHADGGCVAVTIDLARRDLLVDAPARIAIAAALARQEVAGEASDVSAPPELGHLLAMRAPDPRDAAERAAWWSLARPRAANEVLRVALAIGVAPDRDGAAGGASLGEGSPSPLATAVRAEIDRATTAFRAPVVEARTRVERGQGETWVLVASTCGTLPEASHDAGTGAVLVTAAAARAEQASGDVRVEPFVAPDGIGVLAHGPAHVGESAAAYARRLSDAAARSFAAEPLDGDAITRARTALLLRASRAEAQSLAALGAALAPGHPSWLQPTGTLFGISSFPNDAIASRAAAMRDGPLRVAVLANTDAEQAEQAVRSVDRWVARRPGAPRSCPPRPEPTPALAGTYAVDLPPGAAPSALLALPLPDSSAARTAAAWVAAALSGPDGLLARAVGGGQPSRLDAALAREWNCAVLGSPPNQALAIRLVASEASLDAAVAATRALLDRLRQGSLLEEDRSRAEAFVAARATLASIDPRARVIDLWRAEAVALPPSLDALRSFAASLLDEALVIVASRTPHVDAAERPTLRDSNPGSRP